MSGLERAMLGLYGGAWLALLVVSALALWYGRDFELLLANDGSGAWAYLGLWAAMAIAIVPMPRADQGWRVILVLGAVGLLTVAGLGWWRSTGFAAAMAASLIVIAAAMLCLAPLLDAARIQRKRPQRTRTKRVAHARRWHLLVAWTAWSFALCVSFWSAWRGEDPATRGSGAVLLLGVFFVALPAVALGAWRRRVAAAWLLLTAALSLLFVVAADAAAVSILLGLAAGAFAWAGVRHGAPV